MMEDWNTAPFIIPIFHYSNIPLQMSLLKKLAGETAIYGISSILSRLLNWVVLTPYFTRIFAPAQYGISSDLYTWIALLLVIFTYRMETAFFRFGRQSEDRDRSFATASGGIFMVTLIFTAILLLLQQPIANWLKYPTHPDYIVWLVLIVAADALAAIPFARLRLANRPIQFAFIKTLSIIINILLVFFFFEVCPWLINNGWTWIATIYDENNRIAYIFIANFLASAFTLLQLLPIYFKISLQFDFALLRKMSKYSLPLVFAAIAGVVNQLIGIPMLRFLESDTAAGIFSAASKLAVLMNLFTQAFNYASEPFFFRHADRTDSKQIYAQVAQAFALVGSIVFLGIMLYLNVIQYFLGKDYREGLGILPIMLLANLFLGLFYSVSIWFKLSDNTNVGGWIAIIGSIITLLINFLFIPNPAVSFYAPAWASLACYGFMLVACYVIGQRKYPIDYPVGRILLYIGLALGFYGISVITGSWLVNKLLLQTVVNTALFGIYLLILYRLEKNGFLRVLRGRG